MSQAPNRYTKISVNKIIEILAKLYDVHVHRRWVFYCIQWLKDQRFINREPRIYNDSAGRVSKKSSMIAFAKRGIDYLVKTGVLGAREMHENMIAWFKQGDGRWPYEHEYYDQSDLPEKPQDKERLRRLAEIVGTSIRSEKVTK